MGNKKVGQSEIPLKILEKIDDLRLDGDIKCRNRLIADNEFRIKGKGTGNTDALTLAAGKLMRIAIVILSRKPTTSSSSWILLLASAPRATL